MAELVLVVIIVVGGGPGPDVPVLLPATRRCDALLVTRCCTVGGADPSTGSTWSYEWKFCLQLDWERYKYSGNHRKGATCSLHHSVCMTHISNIIIVGRMQTVD